MSKHPFENVQNWAKSAGLYSYAIFDQTRNELCATVVFKYSKSNMSVHCVARWREPETKAMKCFESRVRGYGFDRATAAMGGFQLPGRAALVDQGERWDDQLRSMGLMVVQTL